MLYREYEPVNTLHEQVQELVAGIEARSAEIALAGEGAEAPEISLPTPEGDTIKLSSTRGSVVLLDFWASWCAPCRQENPNLVKAYNLYHKKGFQIYQVSLDKTKEAWIKGIEDDQLGKWIHVSDIQYWNSNVVPLYKIESIPSNFLLDKEGRIIASNLRGEHCRKNWPKFLIKNTYIIIRKPVIRLSMKRILFLLILAYLLPDVRTKIHSPLMELIKGKTKYIYSTGWM